MHSDHGFKQAPLEKITKEQYDEMIAKCQKIEDISSICEDKQDQLMLTSQCKNGSCPIR